MKKGKSGGKMEKRAAYSKLKHGYVFHAVFSCSFCSYSALSLSTTLSLSPSLSNTADRQDGVHCLTWRIVGITNVYIFRQTKLRVFVNCFVRIEREKAEGEEGIEVHKWGRQGLHCCNLVLIGQQVEWKFIGASLGKSCFYLNQMEGEWVEKRERR